MAHGKALARTELRSHYTAEFVSALTEIATPQRQTNVLEHIVGYFRSQLGDASRHELLTLIEDYHRGLAPLIVPITLIRQHVRRHDIQYLRGQIYLDPHPKELMLRNHV